MKTKIILSIFLTSIFTCLHSQNVYIPDQNFKTYLIQQGVDLNNDNEISYDEASIVNYLDISYIELLTIENIAGIEAFVSLDTLVCAQQEILIFDSIAELPLKYFDCCYNPVESIDFTLPELEYLNCTETNISQLDASLFPVLRTLVCSPSEGLIINNPLLEELVVESYIPIDTYFAPELVKLDCHPTSAPDLSNNINLEYLILSSPQSQIENIGLSENVNLKHVFIRCNLTSIDLSNNTDITYLNLHDNELLTLDLSNNLQLDTLFCHVNHIQSLDLSNNLELQFVFCNANEISELDVSNLVNLKTLYCEDNQLTDLNLSDNTSLLFLSINYNLIENIDLSSNTQLEYLNCVSNMMIGSLDLSQNINLKVLYCSYNSLQSLDLSNNINLVSLWCHTNNLTYLNVNGLADLQGLRCFNNNLEDLGLHTNTSITIMQCDNNPIDSLDLSHNDSWQVVNLNYMPSLTKVCVSELPVPYLIYTTGSPNVTIEICTFTNIEAINRNEEIVYPNPTTGNLSIKNPIGENSTITIHSISGELIFKTIQKADVEIIDMSTAMSGVYILRIVNDENLIVRKILKK
jgi:Leucine-rich repeat (LRR) protein